MALFNEQIDISDIPSVGTLEYHPLENRYQKALFAFWLIVTVFFAVIIIAFFVFHPFRIPFVGLAIIISIVFLGILLSFLTILFGFKHKKYAVRDKDIICKKGWLWKSTTTIPFNRVQHLSIDQGPIERKLSLAKLKIFTAGGSSSDLTIPGLDPTTADKLKQYIVRKTGLDEEE